MLNICLIYSVILLFLIRNVDNIHRDNEALSRKGAASFITGEAYREDWKFMVSFI